jgi:hypothetical protein
MSLFRRGDVFLSLAFSISSDRFCGRQRVAGHLYRSIVLLISHTYIIIYGITS